MAATPPSPTVARALRRAAAWLHRAASWLRRGLRRRELVALISLLAVSGGLVAFAELAEVVGEAEPHALDTGLLMALRTPGDLADPIGPPWLEEVARDVTALGSTGLLAFWTAVLTGFLLLDRKPRAAVLLVLAVFGGMALAFLLKDLFDRPRPDLVSHGTRVFTASFPSAHSMMAAVAYLTFGALLARLTHRWNVRFYLLAVCAFVALAVGFSRIYLGVHWPSDVLAGWSVGAAWAIACWALARWLQHRGEVEEVEGDGEGDEQRVGA